MKLCCCRQNSLLFSKWDGKALEVSLFLFLLKILHLFCKNGDDAIQLALHGTDSFFCSCVMLSFHLKTFSVLLWVKYLNFGAKFCVSCLLFFVI